MKEININIEGYNVNGICVGCLNYNRKMFYTKDIKEYLKRIADIEVPDGLDVQMCWECLARVRTIKLFREQVLHSYDVLIDYSTKQTFLNSPSDFTQHARETLKLSTIKTTIIDNMSNKELQGNLCDYDVKDEMDVADEKVVPLEMKQESSFSDIDNESCNDIDKIERATSDDDDVTLSNLKTKREKGRGKKGKKKRKEIIENDIESIATKKLKKLPEIMERVLVSEEEMLKIREDDRKDKSFVKLKYKCDLCILAFNTEKLMKDHMAGKHVPKNPQSVQCKICKRYLLSIDHVPRHTSAHMYICRCIVCEYKTSSRRGAARHAGTHSAHDCTDCGANFTTKSKLSYHRGVCKQQRPQCDCCGKVFANKMTLKYHLKVLKKEDKEEKEKLYLPCKGCNKVFHSKKSYRAHVVIHDGVTYPCQVCGKPFQWKRNLARHMRNHRDRDQGAVHECRECGKKFSSRDCLNNHMRLSRKHVNETNYPHSCSYCGKKFASRWCMVDHVDWEHLQRVKYQCSFCFKAFKTAKIMVAHVNNIHEGKKNKEPESEHLCDICGKSYKSSRRLKGHVWSMHTSRSTARSYRCKLCPATFTWQTSVYKHVNVMHNKRGTTHQQRTTKKVEPFITELDRLQYFQQNVNTDIHTNEHAMNIVTNM